MNMTLDGLERLLKQKLPTRKKVNGQTQFNKMNFVRYADDFIVTGESKEFLENEVLPIIRAFMAERGLQLSEEKTVITHIDDGFDFLGKNIRKYKGKLLIKPSKQSVKAFLKKVRGIVKKNKSAKQDSLIRLLNPVIRGWVITSGLLYRLRFSAKWITKFTNAYGNGRNAGIRIKEENGLPANTGIVLETVNGLLPWSSAQRELENPAILLLTTQRIPKSSAIRKSYPPQILLTSGGTDILRSAMVKRCSTVPAEEKSFSNYGEHKNDAAQYAEK